MALLLLDEATWVTELASVLYIVSIYFIPTQVIRDIQRTGVRRAGNRGQRRAERGQVGAGGG